MSSLKNLIQKTDWLLLVFILLITNQSMFVIKILGIVFIFLVRPNFKLNLGKGNYPLFYPLIILLACINAAFFIKDYSINHFAAIGVASMLWLFALLTLHQIKLSLHKNGIDGMHATIQSFTIINLIACIAQLCYISLKTHSLNPYNPELLFPYGMSTGDNVFGIFLENSLYNMMVSGFLAIYFIYKRNVVMALVATLCMTLVYSNSGTLMFAGVLVALLLTSVLSWVIGKFTNRKFWLQRITLLPRIMWAVPTVLIFIVLIYTVVSPKNLSYVQDEIVYKITQPPSTQADTEVRDLIVEQAAKPQQNPVAKKDIPNPEKNANEDAFVKKAELTRSYLQYFKGKQLSFLETKSFLGTSAQHLIMGAGAVRFSSLTAQRMSGLDSGRIFSKILPRYASAHYLNNHYLLVRERLAMDEMYWSNSNWPDSFYNQLFGEYGLAGVILFFATYLWYFLRRIKYWTYTGWLALMLIPFAMLSYLFEPLCVIVFFELLAETDIANQIQQRNFES